MYSSNVILTTRLRAKCWDLSKKGKEREEDLFSVYFTSLPLSNRRIERRSGIKGIRKGKGKSQD